MDQIIGKIDWSNEINGLQEQVNNKADLNHTHDEFNVLQEQINGKADADHTHDELQEIENLIPAQASATNQLADKDFVNSSIATATAEFVGTFNSLTELQATTKTYDNNDYAFVVGEDENGSNYSRYKWNGSEWVFEYTLNNSSFTSEQWKAINSNVTDEWRQSVNTSISNKADKTHTHDDFALKANLTNWNIANANYTGNPNDCAIGQWYSINTNSYSTNMPEINGWAAIITFAANNNASYKKQICFYSNGARLFTRSCIGGTWGTWKKVVQQDDLSSYATKTELNGNTGLTKSTEVDLSDKTTSNFYPVIITGRNRTSFKEVMITSEGGNAAVAYNQNRIHFTISNDGWNDTPKSFFIKEYACYTGTEITIGCIGYGNKASQKACVWLRGGKKYTVYTRDCTVSSTGADVIESATDSNYSKFTVGTNYYGGTNTNVDIVFTPQTTITNGLYSNRAITAPNFVGLATKATADKNGNDIAATYVNKNAANVMGANSGLDFNTNKATLRIPVFEASDAVPASNGAFFIQKVN